MINRRRILLKNAISITTANVTYNNATYDGTLKTASNIVVILDCVTLVKDADYIVINNGGINAGNYSLTIKGIRKYTDYINCIFTIAKANRTISFTSAPTPIIKGSTATVTATVSAGDGTISYSSNNTLIATVNDSTITGVAIGTCTITATIPQTTNYNSASNSYTLSVVEWQDNNIWLNNSIWSS